MNKIECYLRKLNSKLETVSIRLDGDKLIVRARGGSDLFCLAEGDSTVLLQVLAALMSWIDWDVY